MPASDYLNGSDESTTTDDSKLSSTYIEFNERDHQAAWLAVKGGGTIRDTFGSENSNTVHEFYAGLTEAMLPIFESGDTSEVLQFFEPSREEVEAYLDTLDEDEDGSESDDN